MDYLEFADRFTCELRWMPGNECLNPVDINQIPRWYQGSRKEWIEDITEFAWLNTIEWGHVLREYVALAHSGRFKEINQCARLKFERTNEGYLRKIGEQDVFLRIRIQSKNVPVVELAKRMECESILDFEEYLFYCALSEISRKGYMSTIKSRVDSRLKKATRDWKKLFYSIDFVKDSSDSRFQKNEIFVDALNQTYFVL